MQRKKKVSPICRYCGGKVVLTDASAIYGKGNDPIYLCTNCNAYVGCHKGTTRPLGKLANAALRMKRQETHGIFDAFWKARGWNRSGAYIWLARGMSLSEDDAHIGNFEMDECEQVIHLCRAQEKKEAA